MVLKVISSNSNSNSYILENENEALILELGSSPMDIKTALNFDIRKITGAIVSHSHLDHSRHCKAFSDMGIEVVKPYEGSTKSVKLGSFKISFFDLVHDVPTYGAYIEEPTMGKLVFATDTAYIKYRFPDVNHIMVEANWSDDSIDNDLPYRNHIIADHMNIKTAAEFVKVNNNPNLMNVVLLHLSESRSDGERFKREIERVTSAKVYVAGKGLQVILSKEPF